MEAEVARIKKRLATIEKRKRQELNQKNKHDSHNKDKSYGRWCKSKRIPYPFMTFHNDDLYATFMTIILTNLEVRHYDAGKLINQELDECLEVLFVMQGKYNIGYEVNKIKRYRRQFGPSTIIGGFQMCFHKRYLFTIQAQTDVKCYAIRKEKWFKIMLDFPDMYRIVKQKCFNFYFNQIFRPLIKQKQQDIEQFGERNDYF